MKPFTKETIDTIIRIGGNGTLKDNNMKPTQEQILNSLSKLIKENKTELKAEKVELGLIDDLVKKSSNALSEYKSIENTTQQAAKTISKAEAKAKALNKTFKDLEADWDKVFKQAKELGVTLEGKTRGYAVDVAASERNSNKLESQLSKAYSLIYSDLPF